MALKPLPRTTSGGAPVVSDVLAIQAATTLTIHATDWVDATDTVLVTGWAYIVLHLDYVKGSETTVQIRILGSSDGGTTWRPVMYKATQGSGVSELTKDPLSLTPANFIAGGDSGITPPFNVAGISRIKVQFAGRGGSSPGTLAIGVSGSILPMAA